MVLMYDQILVQTANPDRRRNRGLDIHEHGFPAYPEYVVTGDDGCPKTIDEVPIGRRTLARPSKAKKVA